MYVCMYICMYVCMYVCHIIPTVVSHHNNYANYCANFSAKQTLVTGVDLESLWKGGGGGGGLTCVYKWFVIVCSISQIYLQPISLAILANK